MIVTPLKRLTFLLHAFCAPGGVALTMPQARSHAMALRRLGFRGLRIAVDACNRELSPLEVKQDERIDDAFKVRCGFLGLRGRVGGDPRGYCFHVVFPTTPAVGAACHGAAMLPSTYNTWGGREHGWGVTGR